MWNKFHADQTTGKRVLKCITNAHTKLDAALMEDAGSSQGSQDGAPPADLSQLSEIRLSISALYSLNETITTSKLSEGLAENDGNIWHSSIKLRGLKSLQGKSREVLDRRLWLSLNTGCSVTRQYIQENYSNTGNQTLQW